jgi:hypothetical protein
MTREGAEQASKEGARFKLKVQAEQNKNEATDACDM